MSATRSIRTAALLATGEELVRGAIVDTNSAWIARHLRRLGIELVEVRVVGDQQPVIAAAVRELAARADLLLIGGGLGPTPDDRTRDALADAAAVPLRAHDEARAQLAAYFARFGRTPSPSNERQLLLPAGADAVPNPRGSAPGIALELAGAKVFALPGVPGELRAMFEQSVLPWLGERLAEPPFREVVLQVVGLPESVVGERIARWMAADGPPRVSDTVRFGVVTICAADRDDAAGRARLAACVSGMEEALGEHLFAVGERSLAEVLLDELRARRATVAVAESCSGGRIAAALTAIAGASDVFLEAAVTYSAAAKERALGVPRPLLEQSGVVSEAVARAMAEGIRERAGATWGVATTGIAGPSGGSAAEPVGVVYLAVAGPAGSVAVRKHFPGDRDSVQQFSVIGALDLLRRQLRAR
ncbi:MAG: CinA family nicotinamide mononucleotide deamidase-related protein [Planctomycetes bacterium]|nr:CinA family nicotinamide mononucleotide deamidase-related protein [Planctomycetota bacterium]